MRFVRSLDSIEFRLPLGFVLLMTAVLVLFVGVANREVEQALLAEAEARLGGAAAQLEALLLRSQEGQVTSLTELTEAPEVVAAAGGSGDDEALGELLASEVGNSSNRGIALLAGGRVVARGDSTLLPTDAETDPGPPGVGPLFVSGDHVAYRIVAPVSAGGETAGYLVDMRRLSQNSESARTIAELIGREAHFSLGNRSGGPWTDLGARVDGPPADIDRSGALTPVEDSDGEARLGVAHPVGGSPWMVWVSLPQSAVLGPQRAFLGRAGFLVVFLLLAAGVGAWLLGRWITAPLARTAIAAEAIAGGDYSSRVTSDRSGEVGRLGDAFNTMAEKVEDVHHRLEQRVRERTAQLEEAMAELQDAQEELVRKERLALLGELAGGVGHELRNPLGVMTNAVYYLQTVLTDRSEAVDDYLEILRHQIHLSEKIVGDLLDFARVKQPQRQEVRLAALVDEQVDRAGVHEEVVVRREYPEEMPPVLVDRDQVGQVVLNLVTNAAQAIEENGSGTLTLRLRSDGDRVELDVGDDGPGIAPELREKIFEPLFTTRARGIGLGLSVCRALLEANDGALALESTPGEGTTVTIRLPTGEAAP